MVVKVVTASTTTDEAGRWALEFEGGWVALSLRLPGDSHDAHRTSFWIANGESREVVLTLPTK